MNKFSSSCILFILLISSPWIIAQNKDCETALEVCGNAPLHFVPAPGEGLPDSDIGNSCVELEFNSMWVKWTVIQSGIITFVITPDSMQDIDFVVFRSESDFDCSNKTEIRCMAAGSTGGPPHEWANCAGATGLSTEDTDVEEPPGCPSTSNNFLAPIEASAGDQYIMLINDFSQSGFGYTLTFGGTAVLDCSTVSAYPGEVKPQLTFSVYPTVSTGIININAVSAELTNAHLTIFNTGGQIVYSKEHLIGAPHQVDLDHLPQGAYNAVLRTSKSSLTKMFLVTR